jgi:hypothetical protein
MAVSGQLHAAVALPVGSDSLNNWEGKVCLNLVISIPSQTLNNRRTCLIFQVDHERDNVFDMGYN